MEYYVYRVDVNGCVYIGCTTKIRRRMQQHNGSARIRRGVFGRYLADNGIKLTMDDFVILHTYTDRREAFIKERETVIDMYQKGYKMLNNLYTPSFTRKGKNLGNTCKDYVVVDIKEHKVLHIHDMRQSAESLGIKDYRLLHSTLKGLHVCCGRYKAFHVEEWEKIENKDFYISGEALVQRDKDIKAKNARRTEREYLVRRPDGVVERVINLERYAREHGINSGNLHNSYKTTHKASGYKVIKRI